MFYASIAISVFALFISPLFTYNKSEKKDAYQWWHVPCFALLYIVVMYLLFHLGNVSSWPGFNMLYNDFAVEAVYVLACALVWQVVSLLLRQSAVHKRLIPFYRKVFANKGENGDKVLPFPYFIDQAGAVRARVGKPFYRRMLQGIILGVALIYMLYFLIMELTGIKFYLLSSFALFGLLPLTDYFHYLKAAVPDEEKKKKTATNRTRDDNLPPSDMEKLWEQYAEMFTNYSVAWARKYHKDEESGKNNADIIENLMLDLTKTTSSKGADGFIENGNLVDVFTRIEPLFNWEEENGRLVLVIIDMPNHFSGHSFLQEMAEELRVILHKGKDLKAYDEYSSETELNSSVVVASLSVLSQRDLDQEWMKRIGLVIVVNQLDKSVSNLCECRKFSYLLHALNKQYQLLFITPLLREIDPTLKNTWLTGSNTLERKLIQYPTGYHQFFIAYNLEDYLERLQKILTVLPSEPLSAGTEMIPIALSRMFGGEEKNVTPVHLLDLAYSNVIEGVEELGKLHNNNLAPVREEDRAKHIHFHLQPFEKVDEAQVFAVIFDRDNNAPAAYSKWVYLGRQENFSVVLSRPYLFRDYFNANFDFFVNAPFAALQPHPSKSRVTLAIILLEMLQKSEMSEQQLRSLLQDFYDEAAIQSVSEIIQQLFTTYFANDIAGKLRTRHHVAFDGSKYIHQNIYQLDFSDSVNLSYLDRITVKDESDNVLFTILKDLLPQNFDRGQTHSFYGKPYEITSFDSANKVLKVRAVNTRSVNVSFYKPVQRVSISGKRRAIEGMESSEVWTNSATGKEMRFDIAGFETNVAVETSRWYEFSHYSCYCPSFDATLMRERKYENGRVLKMTFHFLKTKTYLERKDDIRKSLQILLYEAMRSVFPHHAQYLIISSVGEGDAELPWIFNQFACNDKDEEDALSFYFTEDAHIDLGLIGALSKGDNLGVGYVFRYIFDYLMWLTEEEAAPVGTYDDFRRGKNHDKLAFLKYGRSQLPSYFDVDLLITFIRDFFCKEDGKILQGVAERMNRQELYGECDFCRKRMKNREMERLSDGRMRCPDCSKDAIDTDEAFLKLCDEVKAAFKTHLNIDFSHIPHTGKLIPAVELHKLGGKAFSITNGYDLRQLVGLACDRKDDVFYVENGYKPDATYGTIAHEMTHIWQYNDPDFIKLKEIHEELVEGLAVWTDLFLSEKRGVANVEGLREAWLARDDQYGRGLRFIMQTCPNDPYGYIHDEAKKL